MQFEEILKEDVNDWQQTYEQQLEKEIEALSDEVSKLFLSFQNICHDRIKEIKNHRQMIENHTLVIIDKFSNISDLKTILWHKSNYSFLSFPGS